jgi:RNA polymerase sigma factor (sigma-70 family)
MLGSRYDGEDALQQTFLRAYRALRDGRPPDSVRPWLFAIARNCCRTMLAARRDGELPSDAIELGFHGLAEDVRRRAELRQLTTDLARLPEDQRGALVLFELGDLSHPEIAAVIGCPPHKVKALVFQARTALIAERDARETPCERIRAELEAATGGALRRGALRRHLRQCEPCSAYRRSVARLRSGHPVILPVGVSAAVLDGAAGGSASDRPRRPGSQRQPRRRTRSPTPARSIAATAAGVVRSPANRRHRARVMPSEQPP